MEKLKKALACTGVSIGICFGLYQYFKARKVKDLKDKTALVTGAANGLGKQTAIELAKKREISHLVLWDINLEGLKETKNLVNSFHPKCKVLVQKVNLADRTEIYLAADVTRDFLSGNSPYLVINNAGIVAGNEGFLKCSDEKIELELKINTLAHVWIAKTFLPRMITTKLGGHFVNVVSLAAYVSSGDLASYAMSKKGAKGFAEGMNSELELNGYSDIVKVSCICPGHILTSLFEGFESDSASMTPSYVAKQIIEAVECEKELVLLPKKYKSIAGGDWSIGDDRIPESTLSQGF